jgi:WD40 repeat protein
MVMNANWKNLPFVITALCLGLALEGGAASNTSAAVHGQETARVEPLRTFKGHSKPVNDMAFSPDGKRLASASDGGTVRVFDTASGEELLTLRGHGDDRVLGVTFSPDGKWLASAGWDQNVVLWDAVTGRKEHVLAAAGGGESADRVAFSPNGKWLVAAGELVPSGDDEIIPVWEVATGKRVRTLKGHINCILSIKFSPDGTLLATAGSLDGDIILWEFATGRKLRMLEPNADTIWELAFSPDGKTLVSAGKDRIIRLWDVATGRELRKFTGHTKGILSVAFAPHGKLLASAAGRGEVKLWAFPSGQELGSFHAHSASVSRLVFHPDGRKLATASSDQTVKLWDVAALVPPKTDLPK